MKKIIVAILAVSILFSAMEIFADADGEFNVEALKSSKFVQRGDFWSIAGTFSGFADGYQVAVTVGAYLSSTYVSEGWGPELRITCKNNTKNEFYEVTGFRATVNGKVFSFANLEYNDSRSIHAGYCFGGTVLKEFIEEIKDVKSAVFWFDYKDTDGVPGTAVIGHVHTGDLGDLVSVAKYLVNANAFSIDTDPEGNDAMYGASVK